METRDERVKMKLSIGQLVKGGREINGREVGWNGFLNSTHRHSWQWNKRGPVTQGHLDHDSWCMS